jgi:hypothetical protein
VWVVVVVAIFSLAAVVAVVLRRFASRAQTISHSVQSQTEEEADGEANYQNVAATTEQDDNYQSLDSARGEEDGYQTLGANRDDGETYQNVQFSATPDEPVYHTTDLDGQGPAF